ncbi:Hpt domain-containing protein [Paraburkholderia caledonica]|uniref:Hpt domain-containing protein n=1 Tax=Paraburkholderia caledonica TaxID=134536 RepID=UPI000DF01D91|nr:Hpt domain-containing protein [Paraburkholderia caledonica]AXF18697.1 Hpt domain-containing protein [Paraburkholderia caledonica]
MNTEISCPDSRLLWEKALNLVGDDEHAAAHLLVLIADTNQTTLASLHEHFEVARWEGVGSAAHRIVGSARMLDCGALIALLTALEAAARAHYSELATALMPVVAEAVATLDKSIAKALKSEPDSAA